MFNKQLEYAPHVVGEQEEEHIGAEGEGWRLGKEGRRRTEKSWVVESEKEAVRVYTC